MIDLENGYMLEWTRWDPDLDLNPRYRLFAAELPVEKWGAMVTHPRPDGNGICKAGITFDGPVQRQVANLPAYWILQNHDPVTIGGSVLCHACNAHFVVEDGRARAV